MAKPANILAEGMPVRHVPIAEFKDKLSEAVAAAEAGEEIIITRHGREVARLGPTENQVIARRRNALEELARLRQTLRAEGIGATREEVRAWIGEGRP